MPKDKYYVHCAVQKILCELRKKIDISVVNFWTDGAASQFKSRYVLCNMTYLKKQEIQASWHFFATSHGKGAVDGIGGEVKRRARLAALSGEARVQNAKEFIQIVNKKTERILMIEIENECVEREREMLNGRWDGIDAIPSIQKNHFFETVDIDVVTFGLHSRVDITETHQFRGSENEETEESENEMEPENVPDELESEYVSKENVGILKDLKIGDWVKVRYEIDNKEYPGEVITIGENDVQVKVMVRKFSGFFKWPIPEDKIFYPVSAILAKISLPEPVGRRGQYRFPEIP